MTIRFRQLIVSVGAMMIAASAAAQNGGSVTVAPLGVGAPLLGGPALGVLATGLARVFWGAKGAAYYAGRPLFRTKVVLFAVVGLISIRPTLRFARWRKALRASGALPSQEEVRSVRKLVMVQAHIVPLIPLPAVFLARGF